ncbi:glycosyltransferase [Mesoflavibacter zeaxanthinifaciens]|uniref:glycosyltransferase n=1 Tax=Mesoflavibacter zeaxanthinifaciens TaxID=393060 RepID=UPI003A90B96E
MKHFIATRFNLKVETWKTAKDGSTVLTDEWLEERFELFEKYCYPSVINQKNKNFYWVIFFDIDTPKIFKGRIENLIRNHDFIDILYIDGIKAMNHSFNQYILEKLENTKDFIITSRLDNDDAIHQDFVGTIQKLAIPKNETVIDLRKGYQMDISENVYEYRNYLNSFNPFISFIEVRNNLKLYFQKCILIGNLRIQLLHIKISLCGLK